MRDKIKEYYAKVIGRDLEDDEWDLSLEGDLDMDGLDFVEFIMDLEAQLQISIPDDQAENLFTPNQWLAYLKAVLKPQEDKLISEPKDMKTQAEKVNELIARRGKIAKDYCVSKGWPIDPVELSFDQILEIRALDSWKNVPNEIESESSNSQTNEK